MYQALYREFRPLKFKDSTGQDNIAEILKAQILNNETTHAYLFTGVRGTGKTSFAKIFARAVNCLNSKDGEPCNECENCKLILSNNATDVVEMDAASNTGVDSIRAIIDEVNFVPTKLKYRVYIIDEAHMLSNNAWNAFLKTLEEPPSHVKFILATTEPQKLLPTILSRCQRFDFKKINSQDIFNHLKEISKKVNLDLEENALYLISTLADGSMRDGISILESVRSINGKITLENIRDIIGIPNFINIIDLLKAMFLGNNEKVLKLSNNLIQSGKEAANIITEMLKMIETLIIYSPEILEKFSMEEKTNIEELKDIVNKNKINLYLYISKLSELYSNLKFAYNKNIIFTAALLSLTEENMIDSRGINIENIEKNNIKNNIRNNTDSNNNNNIINNISENKNKNENENESNSIIKNINKEENLNINNSNSNNNNNANTDIGNNKDKNKTLDKDKNHIVTDSNTSTSISIKDNVIFTNNTRTVDFWRNVMQNVAEKKEFRIFANLVQSKVQIVDDVLEIKVLKSLSDMDMEYLQEAKTIDKIKQAIFEETNSSLNIKLIFKGGI